METTADDITSILRVMWTLLKVHEQRTETGTFSAQEKTETSTRLRERGEIAWKSPAPSPKFAR